jgi:hypothetical protein
MARFKVLRIFTGSDGESHFEDLEIPLSNASAAGLLSELGKASGIVFRETGLDYNYDWHRAPRRQYVINLSGGVEIEIGDGSKRRLGPGEVLLAEDTTGRGHRSVAIGNEPRRSIFVMLD